MKSSRKKPSSIRLRDELSSSHSDSRLGKSGLKKTGKSKSSSTHAHVEKQGPIDWSCYALKIKYRGEREREEAWRLWMSSTTHAQKSFAESDMILPVVKIERHPFFVNYYQRLEMENSLSSTRTRARLLMKRFVFDVQEVWLTNLQHLREHNPALMYATADGIVNNNQALTDGKSELGLGAPGAHELKEESQLEENFGRGNGLRDRRDVRAIESMDSQVQSVSLKRAFSRAYHTSRMPPIEVMLDYEPTATPKLTGIKLLPPTVEPIMSGVRLSLPPTHTLASELRGTLISPVVHSTALFPELVYILHIDRLLPSSDYQGSVQDEVLWRFTIYRNDDVAGQVYVSPEPAIASYVTSIILTKSTAEQQQQQQQQGGDTPDLPVASRAVQGLPPVRPMNLLCSSLVYTSPQPIFVPYVEPSDIALVPGPGRHRSSAAIESSQEWSISYSVAVLGLTREADIGSVGGYFDCLQNPDALAQARDLIHSIKVEICAEVVGMEDMGLETGNKVYLECSLAELRHLLRAPDAPLGDMRWWLAAERGEDLWPALHQHLVLEATTPSPATNAAGGDHPMLLPSLTLRMSAEQRQERSSQGSGIARVTPEQVEGALGTLQALSCASELLEVLRLVPGAVFSEERRRELWDASPSSQFVGEGEVRPSQVQAPHMLHLEGAPEHIFTHVDGSHRIQPHFRYPTEEFDLGSSDTQEQMRGLPGVERAPLVTYAPPQSPLLFFDDNVCLDSAQSDHRPPRSRPASRQPEAQGTRAMQLQSGTGVEAHWLLLDGDSGSGGGGQEAGAEVRAKLQAGDWEGIADTGSNSSLIASGALPTVTQVPGACEYGRRGLWFADHLTAPVEYTQAAARFFRELGLSASNSVFVNMTLALDSAMMVPTTVAWEAFSSYPAPSPAEEVLPVVPSLASQPETLCAEPLVSPIEQRLSATVMVFSALPVEGVDFVPRDTVSRPTGFRRHLPQKNEFGYREQVEVTLLGVDPVLATMVFGITKTGAVVNSTGVNNRNMWHNTLAVTEHICRPRAPKDYHYLLVLSAHHGPNEPTRYTTRMHGQRMVGLTSSAFTEFEDAYNQIQELRDVFNKQIALDAKIEKVQNDINLKHQLQRSKMQQQMQRKFEKRIRKATKSELGWRNRFKMSTLLEVQGNWERRRDERTGMFFFRCLQPERRPGTPHIDLGPGERFAETCQWEIPPNWDGDPLTTDLQGGKQLARDAYTAHRQQPPRHTANESARRAAGVSRGIAAVGSPSMLGDATAASFVSDLQEEELDQFDLVPSRFDPNQEAQLQRQQQLLRSQGGPGDSPGGGKGVGTHGAFEQPPDEWLPGRIVGGPAGATPMARDSGGSLMSTRQGGARGGRGGPHRGGSGSVSMASGQGRGQGRDDDTDLDSVAADRSLAESVAPTIDTVNLEHIAEQLVSSDELMRVIARRLGLSEAQVVPADELSSVFSVSTMGGEGRSASSKLGDNGAGDLDLPDDVNEDGALNAPRDNWIDPIDEPEFDSDDDLWSDDEHEVGDFDEVKELGAPEDMPQTQLEAAQLRRRERKEEAAARKSDVSVPSQVPALDLAPISQKHGLMPGAFMSDDGETREEVFGWRRLPRPVIRAGFLSDALRTHTKPPDATSSNTLNAPVFLMPISPVDACKYVPEELAVPIESIFVPDAKKDMERAVATVERNIRREEELARNLPTDDLLLFGEAKEFTSADAFLARQLKEDQAVVEDPREAAVTKAVLAAKSSNIAMMEDALAEDIPVNTADEYGNTLLILAAQQGSKRMAKFLLRRGANINMQSLTGNTPLHYCYAYSNNLLGEYLKSKGADDSIVNVDGLTCYEGLSRESMNEQYGDDEEAYIQGDDDNDDDDGLFPDMY